MLVEVTQEDIDKGTRSCCRSCPVARAARRAARREVGRNVFVDAGPWDIQFGSSITYELPAKAQQFIKLFDRHRNAFVRPFSFELPDFTKEQIECLSK